MGIICAILRVAAGYCFGNAIGAHVSHHDSTGWIAWAIFWFVVEISFKTADRDGRPA